MVIEKTFFMYSTIRIFYEKSFFDHHASVFLRTIAMETYPRN